MLRVVVGSVAAQGFVCKLVGVAADGEVSVESAREALLYTGNVWYLALCEHIE